MNVEELVTKLDGRENIIPYEIRTGDVIGVPQSGGYSVMKVGSVDTITGKLRRDAWAGRPGGSAITGYDLHSYPDQDILLAANGGDVSNENKSTIHLGHGDSVVMLQSTEWDLLQTQANTIDYA
ncbi:hypothetical protein CMO88_00310 [Candidatus Woesearchaeota archaeon]|nr:hypothetical protein [Candidatus Woesearchaeota archaeon]|tara:strand:- start:62687 stop:63058 length:372 start_codon:yes stop_codon:yes gene_type:complete